MNNLNWGIISSIFLAFLAASGAIYQVKLNIISSARVRWIENLRDLVSQFTSEAYNLINYLNLVEIEIKNGVKSKEAFGLYHSEIIFALNKIMEISTKIKLALNIEEALHKKLNKKLSNLNRFATLTADLNKDEEKYKEELNNAKSEVIDTAQAIIKKEWDRVSKLFIQRWWEKESKIFKDAMKYESFFYQ